MKKLLLGVAMFGTILLGACGGESAEEKELAKSLAEAEELAAELNQKLVELEGKSTEETEVITETVEEEVAHTSEENLIGTTDDGLQQFEWDGDMIEIPQDLGEQTFKEDANGIRWYENGSPVEHDLYTYSIVRIDSNKRMASELSPYELLPDEGYTQIIVEIAAEHTGNEPSDSKDGIEPRLYTLKDGGEKTGEYTFDKGFEPKIGLNKTYYEIIGTTMNGQPRKTDRGDRFVSHLIYEVPNELLGADKEWVLFQKNTFGYTATKYSRHLGKLK